MPAQLNDHDLLVRIDARTETLQQDSLEIKEELKAKADAERVARIEVRQDKSEARQETAERKLNYILGGLVVFEAALKFVAR